MNTNPFNLDGRLALVTGSSRGIGKALAEALGNAGARLVLNGRNEATLETTAAEFRDKGFTVHICVCDVTDAEAERDGPWDRNRLGVA